MIGADPVRSGDAENPMPLMLALRQRADQPLGCLHLLLDPKKVAMMIRTLLALSAAPILLAAPAHARTPLQAPMTPQDLATLSRVAAPTVSPDGRLVAWQQTETHPGTYARSTRIMVVNPGMPDNQPVQVVDRPEKNESAPAFAPDGALYYLSNASGSNQVWRTGSVDAPSAETQVTSGDEIAGFKLSPDGKQLLVWADVAMGARSLISITPAPSPAQGTGRHYKDGAGFIRHWDEWETPGIHSRAFVFDLINGQAANPRAVSGALVGDTPSKPSGGGEELAWSADGKSVFFTLRLADKMEPRSTNLDIYQAPADGSGAPVNLTASNAATDTLPAPSPDGKWLAYAAMARPTYEADRQVVMLRNLATGEVRALTGGWDRSAASITWTPDSKAVIVTAQDWLEHPAFRVDIKSGKFTRLTETGNVFDTIALPGGAMVHSQNGVTAPTDIMLRDAKGNMRNLSRANDARLASFAPVTYQQFDFAGAEGATVQGQIITPANATGPLPTLLLVHGGPQGSFFNSWSTRWNPRLFANGQYAVVTIDFHGSTGYGQAFTDSINQDWGGKPLTDLKLGMAAAAKANPVVNPANACALGGSYGGYMMNWIAGQWPDGFKCLVNHAGIFDLRAMAMTTEELWFDEWDHGGPWWSRPNAERWNPVNHVTNWKTPTLFIHGEKDYRVPYTQSIAGWTAAQRLGVPSEILMFPDENHWILKGKNSVQWYGAVFDFVGRNLKEPTP
jgi:dipeptidyl aminopeptidase/acylaminoacyl peptidase